MKLKYTVIFLLFFVIPATAMPVTVNLDNIAHWDIDDQQGDLQRIDNQDGSVRIWVTKRTELSHSIDLTNVDKITFNIDDVKIKSKGSGVNINSNRLSVYIDSKVKVVKKSYELEGLWEIDTKEYNGYHKFSFVFTPPTDDSGMGIRVYNFSVVANSAVPFPFSIHCPDTVKPHESVTTEIDFTAGDRPDGDYLYIDWGDRSPLTKQPVQNLVSPYQTQHTYDQEGTYQISCYGHNIDGGATSPKKTAEITVISAEIITDPKNGHPLDLISFSANFKELDSANWNFGDGSSSSELYPQHTYTEAGSYSVKLTIMRNGKSIVTTRTILIKSEYIHWNKPEYNQSEDAVITWDLLPSESRAAYQIFIFPADEEGHAVMGATPIYSSNDINSTGTLSISLSPPTFTGGRYIACVVVQGQNTNVAETIRVIPHASDTHPQEPTMKSQKEPQKESPTSDLSSIGNTPVTFRVVDKRAGTPITGAMIKVVGKKATNPVSWFGQMIGKSWGENIIGTELSGITDVNGAVTFVLFRSVMYDVSVSYQGITESFAYQPTTATAEHTVRINTQSIKKSPSQTVITDISLGKDAITVTYEDKTESTTSLSIEIHEQKLDGTYVLVGTRTIQTTKATERFALQNSAGKSYRITLKADTAIYGPIMRTHMITFAGPMIKIGIPESMYIYLVMFLLITFGAIGTQTTAPIIGVCICFLGWIFYFFGWLFVLGSVAPIALGIATILAILYYIRTRVSVIE